jgi:hypothetical protein
MSDENNVELGSVFEFADDISKAEAPPPLPPRSYLATVTGAVAKVSQKGGKYAAVEFTIAPDQFPPDFAAIQQDSVKLYYRRVGLDDTARTRFNIRKFCEALRVPVSKRFDLNDCIGKTASVKVAESEYMGEKRAEIQAVEAN